MRVVALGGSETGGTTASVWPVRSNGSETRGGAEGGGGGADGAGGADEPVSVTGWAPARSPRQLLQIVTMSDFGFSAPQ